MVAWTLKHTFPGCPITPSPLTHGAHKNPLWYLSRTLAKNDYVLDITKNPAALILWNILQISYTGQLSQTPDRHILSYCKSEDHWLEDLLRHFINQLTRKTNQSWCLLQIQGLLLASGRGCNHCRPLPSYQGWKLCHFHMHGLTYKFFQHSIYSILKGCRSSSFLPVSLPQGTGQCNKVQPSVLGEPTPQHALAAQCSRGACS